MAAIELYNTPLFSDTNLKLYYRLENTTDSSPTGATLTNVGAIAFSTAKFNNGAIIPSTTSHYLNTPSSTAYYSTVFSWCCWIYNKGAPTDYAQFAKSTGGTNFNFALQNDLASPPTLTPYVYNTIGGEVHAGIYTTSLSTWTHYAATFDGTNLRFYVNGLYHSISSSFTGTLANSSCPIYLGVWNADRGASDGSGNCNIDDFAFFNRVLSGVEINKLYTGNWSNGFFMFFNNL